MIRTDGGIVGAHRLIVRAPSRNAYGCGGFMILPESSSRRWMTIFLSGTDSTFRAARTSLSCTASEFLTAFL